MALVGTDRGTGNDNATALTFTLSPASNFAAGLAVLCVAADNASLNGATNDMSVTDSLGNTWTARVAAVNDPGVASDGVQGSIFTTSQTAGLLTTATVITVTFGVGPKAKAWTLMEVVSNAGGTAVFAATGASSNATATSASVTTASILVGQMVIGAGFVEHGVENTFTADTDTTNGTWSAIQTNEVGSTTTGISVVSQRKIQTTTASTQTFNVTLSASSDLIASWISVRESIPVSAAPPQATLVLSTFASTVAALSEPLRFPTHTHDAGATGYVFVRDVENSDKGGEWESLDDRVLAVAGGAGENVVNTWTPGIAKGWTGIVTSSYHFGITYSPELALWVTVGTEDPETNAHIATSTDRIMWTERTVPVDVLNLVGVCWAPQLALFVAVGADDSGDPIACTSPDGVTWTRRSTGVTVAQVVGLGRVCWSGSLLVAVGPWGSVEGLMTSPDGITWTLRTSGATNVTEWYCCAHNGTQFVVGGRTTSGARCITSPDGVTWTVRTIIVNAISYELRGLAWSTVVNNWVIAGANLTTVNTAAGFWSQDAITWTTLGTQVGDAGPWYGVAFNGTVLVGIAHSSGDNSRVFVSRDGIFWGWRIVNFVSSMFDIASDDDGNCVTCGEESNFWSGTR